MVKWLSVLQIAGTLLIVVRGAVWEGHSKVPVLLAEIISALIIAGGIAAMIKLFYIPQEFSRNWRTLVYLAGFVGGGIIFLELFFFRKL